MNETDRLQRIYVARMAAKLKAGAISRRQFLRAAAIAGIGISSMAMNNLSATGFTGVKAAR